MDAKATKKIKEALNTTTLKSTGFVASGCINQGEAFEIDDNRVVFIKRNKNKYAEVMFKSEIASLKALEKTNTVRVPSPITYVESDGTYFCVLEYVSINHLGKFSVQLGEKFAELHLHNENVAKGSSDYVSRFGFPTTTCVGLLPVDNTWHSDWPTFYTRRLDEQVQRLLKSSTDAELSKLWSELKPLIPKFFENIEVKPSLLHGDLWTGNVGETDTEPIIFDPGSVYGHHEFDLAMTTMFGSLGKQFYDAYHAGIPKAPGFDTREDLYHLFHYLNHWNHFGTSYRGQSISKLKSLVKTKFPLT